MNFKYFSQFGQDKWVIEKLGHKKNGYFVEAGATNGKDGSNSYGFETQLDWKGILCEPNPNYHKALFANRTAHIETDCLYDKTGQKVSFHCGGIFGGVAQDFGDNHVPERHRQRSNGDKITVNTISLNDLLSKYKAPSFIDYISLDTEGSELKILSSLDFSKYKVNLFTIEHNTNYRRDSGQFKNDLIEFMSLRGYDHKFQAEDVFFWLRE